MKKILMISLLSFLLVGLLGGCACLKESVRQFLGISTKEIENVRSKAIVRIVDYDYSTCYKMVEDRLDAIGSYVYAKRDDLIAVYISTSDTTPAGVFFRRVDKQKTELSIASPAKDTKEYLAEKIFEALK